MTLLAVFEFITAVCATVLFAFWWDRKFWDIIPSYAIMGVLLLALKAVDVAVRVLGMVNFIGGHVLFLYDAILLLSFMVIQFMTHYKRRRKYGRFTGGQVQAEDSQRYRRK